VKAVSRPARQYSLSESKPSAAGKTSKFPAQVDNGVVEQREGKHVLDALAVLRRSPRRRPERLKSSARATSARDARWLRSHAENVRIY